MLRVPTSTQSVSAKVLDLISTTQKSQGITNLPPGDVTETICNMLA
jgi:hypothetical protein